MDQAWTIAFIPFGRRDWQHGGQIFETFEDAAQACRALKASGRVLACAVAFIGTVEMPEDEHDG